MRQPEPWESTVMSSTTSAKMILARSVDGRLRTWVVPKLHDLARKTRAIVKNQITFEYRHCAIFKETRQRSSG